MLHYIPSMKKKLVNQIIELVEKLNGKAQDLCAADPLQDISVQLEIKNHNNGEQTGQALYVKIILIYLSGGGIESSYVLNDIVSFTVTDTMVLDCKYETEMGDERCPPMSLSEETVKNLIQKIEKFCARVIKQPMF